MEAVVLVIHLIIAVAIIISVLLQQSEGGGLGIGGGGLGNFASQRSTTNFMTKLTTILGIAFVATSLTLAILANSKVADKETSILDVTVEDAVDIKSSINNKSNDNASTKKTTSDVAKDVSGEDSFPVPPNALLKDEADTSKKPEAPVSK